MRHFLHHKKKLKRKNLEFSIHFYAKTAQKKQFTEFSFGKLHKWCRVSEFIRTQGERRSRLRGFLNLLFHFRDLRFIHLFGNDVLLKVISYYKPVAVPDGFPDKGIYKQFARLDIVGIFKDLGKKISSA